MLRGTIPPPRHLRPEVAVGADRDLYVAFQDRPLRRTPRPSPSGPWCPGRAGGLPRPARSRWRHRRRGRRPWNVTDARPDTAPLGKPRRRGASIAARVPNPAEARVPCRAVISRDSARNSPAGQRRMPHPQQHRQASLDQSQRRRRELGHHIGDHVRRRVGTGAGTVGVLRVVGVERLLLVATPVSHDSDARPHHRQTRPSDNRAEPWRLDDT